PGQYRFSGTKEGRLRVSKACADRPAAAAHAFVSSCQAHNPAPLTILTNDDFFLRLRARIIVTCVSTWTWRIGAREGNAVSSTEPPMTPENGRFFSLSTHLVAKSHRREFWRETALNRSIADFHPEHRQTDFNARVWGFAARKCE